VALDGYPSLPFEIHAVQNLVAKLALVDEPGILDKAIGKGRFPVINVGDDAEVTYLGHGVFRLNFVFFYDLINIDDLVKSRYPVEKRGPGVFRCVRTLDSGFRRNDEKNAFSTFCETINMNERPFS